MMRILLGFQVKMMLNATPELRINLHEFTKVGLAGIPSELPANLQEPLLTLNFTLRLHSSTTSASRPYTILTSSFSGTIFKNRNSTKDSRQSFKNFPIESTSTEFFPVW
jgi:hypothetical protein